MPFGFPNGQNLFFTIIDGCANPTTPLHKDLLNCDIPTAAIQKFGTDLRDAALPSIDLFLATPRGKSYSEIGKLAIASVLLNHEEPSNLIVQPDDSANGKWYGLLIEAFGISRDSVKNTRENLSIITFNYDRSLEHFLYSSFSSTLDLEPQDYEELVMEIPLVHFYGGLGRYPFPSTNQSFSNTSVSYGIDSQEPIRNATLQNASVTLRTPSEVNVKTDGIALLSRRLISEADRVVFLGFGYHPKNLELLFLDNKLENQELMGTTMGLLPNKIENVRNFFDSSFGLEMNLGQNTGRDCGLYIRSNSVLT